MNKSTYYFLGILCGLWFGIIMMTVGGTPLKKHIVSPSPWVQDVEEPTGMMGQETENEVVVLPEWNRKGKRSEELKLAPETLRAIQDQEETEDIVFDVGRDPMKRKRVSP